MFMFPTAPCPRSTPLCAAEREREIFCLVGVSFFLGSVDDCDADSERLSKREKGEWHKLNEVN